MVLDRRRSQRFYRSTLKGIIAPRSHPQDASTVQKLPFPAPLILHPELERLRRHLGIRLIRAVRSAHDPRLSAGGRSGITGPPCVDEHDASAPFEKMQRSPSTEGSSADDCDVRFGFHEDKEDSGAAFKVASFQVSAVRGGPILR